MPDLPALEVWRIEYALRSAEQLHARWSQFAAVDPCVMFVDLEAQWILNCSTAPEEFVRSQQHFRERPVFVRVGGRFATRGQSLDSSAFIQAVPATIAVPRPAQSGSDLAQDRPVLLISALEALERLHSTFAPDTPTEKWFGIFIHEYFHLLQFSDPRAGHPDDAERGPLVQLYESDAEYRRMLDSELTLLADEVAREDVDAARARAALRAWNERYQARRGYLSSLPKGAELVELDQRFCYIEGVARYVEDLYLVGAHDHGRDDGSIDPSFRHFSDYEGRGYAGMPNRQLSPEYYYALGMHIALLLDRVEPDWPRGVHAAPEWLIGTATAIAREPPAS